MSLPSFALDAGIPVAGSTAPNGALPNLLQERVSVDNTAASTGSAAPTIPFAPSTCSRVAFDPACLLAMDAAISQAIEERKLAGGVLWLQRSDEIYQRAYGHRVVEPQAELMQLSTIFDIASLTKVIVTTTILMQLVEAGKVELDAPVAKYIPEFGSNGKDTITVLHLMTHTSGLRPSLPEKLDGIQWSGYETAIKMACGESLATAIGAQFVYCDIGFILLGEIIRRITGTGIDQYATEHIFKPLQMNDTCFLPPASLKPRIAPTEEVNGVRIHGVVHDPTAQAMGNIAGHAGVFSTAPDIARFCRAILNNGELEGRRILSAASVALMTSIQTGPNPAKRGLGWDIDTPFSAPRGEIFRSGFGHTGWTGTSVWIIPEEDLFILFLSSRLYPAIGNVIPLRQTIGTIAAEAIGRSK